MRDEGAACGNRKPRRRLPGPRQAQAELTSLRPQRLVTAVGVGAHGGGAGGAACGAAGGKRTDVVAGLSASPPPLDLRSAWHWTRCPKFLEGCDHEFAG